MPGSETIIPVVDETVLVDKTEVVTGRLRIQTVTDNVQEIVKTDLSASNLEVTRISVEREIDAFPEVRVEGDVTIIPIVEERLVIQKRLFLKEELHIQQSISSEVMEIPVDLRKQRVEMTRESTPPTNPRIKT